MLQLDCDVSNDQPHPLPVPMRSWFKDGELIYTQLLHSTPDASEFLMNHTILQLGVLDPHIFLLLTSGGIYYNTQVTNITLPSMLTDRSITIDEASELVFSILLGKWTCIVSNSLGTSSVHYVISECGKCSPLNAIRWWMLYWVMNFILRFIK